MGELGENEMLKPRKELAVYCDYCGLEITQHYTATFCHDVVSLDPTKIYLTFCATASMTGCVVTKEDCMLLWFEQHETSPLRG